jgi:hypothetical protein
MSLSLSCNAELAELRCSLSCIPMLQSLQVSESIILNLFRCLPRRSWPVFSLKLATSAFLFWADSLFLLIRVFLLGFCIPFVFDSFMLFLIWLVLCYLYDQLNQYFQFSIKLFQVGQSGSYGCEKYICDIFHANTNWRHTNKYKMTWLQIQEGKGPLFLVIPVLSVLPRPAQLRNML